MAVGKEVKFSVAMDQQSFNGVKNALDGLIRKSQELAKTMSGLGIGGSVGGKIPAQPGISNPGTSSGGGVKSKSPMASIILEQAEAFKQMGNIGANSLRSLSSAIKSSINEQTTQIKTLKNQLAELSKAYENMADKGSQSAQDLSAKMSVAHQALTQKQDLVGALGSIFGSSVTGPSGSNLVGAMAAAAKGGPTGFMARAAAMAAGGGGGGMGLLTPIGPGGMNPGNLMQALMGGGAGAVAMRSLGYVGAGAKAAFNFGGAMDDAPGALRRDRWAAVSGSVEKMRRGDISDAMAEKYIAQMSADDRDALFRTSGGSDAQLRAMGGAASGLMRSFSSGGGSGIAGATGEGLDTAMAVMRQKMVEGVQGEGGFQTRRRALDYADETRADREALGLGGMGMGLSYNRKVHKVKAERNFSSAEPELATFSQDFVTTSPQDDYTNERAKALYISGFSRQEAMGAMHQARGLGFNRGEYSNAMMRAGRMGFGNLGGVMAQAGMGGGDAGFLTRGALGGGIGTAAGLQLGSSIFGYDPRGTVSGAGMLEAIQSGFGFSGKITDMTTVNQIKQGMHGLDNITTGASGYQQGMNIVSAIQANPGGTVYAQDAAAQMGIKELSEIMRGGSSATSRAYGIGQKEARAQLEGVAHGVFSQYTEQGGDDPASKAMRKMRDFGGTEAEYLKKLVSVSKNAKSPEARRQAAEDLEAIGVWAGDRGLGGAEGGIGVVKLLGAAMGANGKKLSQGELPSGGIDPESKAEREKQWKLMEQNSADWKKHGMELLDSMFGNAARLKVTDAFGTFATSLENLSKRMDEISGVKKTGKEKDSSFGVATQTAAATIVGVTDIYQGAAPNLVQHRINNPTAGSGGAK